MSSVTVSRFLLQLRRAVDFDRVTVTGSEQVLSSVRFRLPDNISGNLGEQLDFSEELDE